MATPATPAADSECPTFALTEPMAQKFDFEVWRRKGLGQRGDLQAVAQLRAGAVTLDVADGLRMDARLLQSAADQAGLCVRIRRGVAVGAAAVIERAAADDGVHVIAVGECLAQRLQNERSHTFARNEAVVSGAIAVAFAIARQHPALAEGVVLGGVEIQVHAAGDRHLTVGVAEAFAGEMNGHRGR